MEYLTTLSPSGVELEFISLASYQIEKMKEGMGPNDMIK